MCTPAEDGTLHTVELGTTTSAFGVEAMVYGEPGAAVMLLEVTVYTYSFLAELLSAYRWPLLSHWISSIGAVVSTPE